MAKQVIKFFADWCGPCRMYGPTFTQVREELESDEITFLEINVENDPENLSGECVMKKGSMIGSSITVSPADIVFGLRNICFGF